MNSPAPSLTRIIIVDDHPLVRERLAEIINQEADLTVCGEAEDRHEALACIRATSPSFAIIDLTLKNSLGLELIKDLQVAHPEIQILVVSMQDELVYAERCIRAGARGYITKQNASRQIMVAIRKILAGEIFVSEILGAQIVSRAMRGSQLGRQTSPGELLSDRELQVFEQIGLGRSSREIATFLSIDMKTIDTYRARIKEKLILRDPSDLLRAAIAWVHQGNM